MTAHPTPLNNNDFREEPDLKAQAEELSRKWEEILKDFSLPCPMCKGEMEMEGVSTVRLYEFAEGEPGTVMPLDLLPLNFVCQRCGYTAEFDTQLFNPAHLSKLEGAPAERVNFFSVRDYRILLPLRGDERSKTLLDLATAVGESRRGDVAVLDASPNGSASLMLQKKLQKYRPSIGSPTPTTFVHRIHDTLKADLTETIIRLRCNLLMIDARGWGKDDVAGVGRLIEDILIDDLCEVAVVHDRGVNAVNRVLLATSGGPNARAAAPIVLDFVRAFNAELHILYIAPTDDPESQDMAQARIAETLGSLPVDDIKLQKRVILDANPVQALISESAGYDLLVMGGSPRDWRGKIQLKSFSARVARNSDTTTIILIARGDQPRPLLSRFLGIR